MRRLRSLPKGIRWRCLLARASRALRASPGDSSYGQHKGPAPNGIRRSGRLVLDANASQGERRRTSSQGTREIAWERKCLRKQADAILEDRVSEKQAFTQISARYGLLESAPSPRPRDIWRRQAHFAPRRPRRLAWRRHATPAASWRRSARRSPAARGVSGRGRRRVLDKKQLPRVVPCRSDRTVAPRSSQSRPRSGRPRRG
jgi:hypothetical protein